MTLRVIGLTKKITWGLGRRIRPLNNFKNKFFGTLVSVNTNKKVAAITFDDGPDPVWTLKILDVLSEHNAKATFFVIGKRAEKHYEIVKKAYEAGHTIANHTWDHPCLSILPRKQRIEQIQKCKNTIEGHESLFFRPPFGCQSLLSKLDTYLCGYTAVAWDMHATDWDERTSEEIARDLNHKIRPGSIILLHDAQNGKSREEMIKGLVIFLKNNQEYQFVTIPRLLEYGAGKKIIWRKEPNENDLISHRKRFETLDI